MDPKQRYYSGPASLALTMVALTSPEHEMAALKAIQHARFVDFRIVTDLPTPVSILTATGIQEAAGALAQPSQALFDGYLLRVDQAEA